MLTVAWGVCDHSGAIAVIVAPVVSLQVLSTEAAGAVLPKLVGAEGADLASRRRHLVGGALATVIDVHTDDPAVLALKGGHAAALEVPNAEHGHAGRTCLDAGTVEQVPAVAAL